MVICTFFFRSVTIIIIVFFFFKFLGEISETVLDKISFSWDSRPMQQFAGGQATHVFRSVLYYGMYADIEAKRGKYGEYCEVDAFEGAWDGFTTALLRVRILVMAIEAQNTT